MFVSKLIEADEDKIKASIEVNRRIITREIATRLIEFEKRNYFPNNPIFSIIIIISNDKLSE